MKTHLEFSAVERLGCHEDTFGSVEHVHVYGGADVLIQLTLVLEGATWGRVDLTVGHQGAASLADQVTLLDQHVNPVISS